METNRVRRDPTTAAPSSHPRKLVRESPIAPATNRFAVLDLEQAHYEATALIHLLLESYERELKQTTEATLASNIMSGLQGMATHVRESLRQSHQALLHG